MLFVGIDWADLHHDVAILDEKGKELKCFTVPHNREGMDLLKQKLLSLDPDPESFACLLETKNGLLVQFLLEAGFPVYPLNPKVVDYRRKPSGAKSDKIDARLLANIGRSVQPKKAVNLPIISGYLLLYYLKLAHQGEPRTVGALAQSSGSLAF